MKRKTMTTGLLAMGIVIALATLGLVIGNWTQSLSINGNVSVAQINTGLSTAADAITESGDIKNVATCGVTGSGDKLTVDIVNAFPGYGCNIAYSVDNLSKMPVSVISKNATGGAGVKVTDSCGSVAQIDANGSLDCKLSIAVNKGADKVAQGANIAIGVKINVAAFNQAP